MARQRQAAPRKKVASRRRDPAQRRRRKVWVGVALALVASSTLVEGHRIDTPSMADTLLAGDLILVETLSGGVTIPLIGLRLPALGQPASGDVVVCRGLVDGEDSFASRCVAAAGQRVEVRDKVVYIDGERLPDPPFSKYLDARILPASRSRRDNLAVRTVPVGSLFVVGDNRDDSRDSRHWGYLPEDHVIGRPLAVYFSVAPPATDPAPGLWQRLASLPGRIRWRRLGTGVQ